MSAGGRSVFRTIFVWAVIVLTRPPTGVMAFPEVSEKSNPLR